MHKREINVKGGKYRGKIVIIGPRLQTYKVESQNFLDLDQYKNLVFGVALKN